MDPAWLLALAVLAPIGALATLPMLAGRWALALAPLAALPALVAWFVLPTGTRLDLPWLLLGARLELDPLGATFLLFTALLWLVAGLFAVGAHRDDPAAARFAACFLLAMSGNVGLVVAADVLSFYAAFALMGFASYGLVVHRGDPEARHAAKVYIALVLVGEVALFVGMAVTVAATGTLLLPGPLGFQPGPAALALLTIGFGLKTGMVPLHVWLPLAHPAAPVAASAVLSGAMIKAGIIGLMRFLPLGAVALPTLGETLIAVGLAGAFYGVLIGLTQTNPKTVLAYSSISQMGLMILALGIGVAAPETAPTALAAIPLIALHHGLAKGALFLACGVPRPQSVAGLSLFGLGLLLPALALAGAPFTSGLIAKTLLDQLATAAVSGLAAWLPVLLPAAATGTGLLMIRFLLLVLTKKGVAGPPHPLASVAWSVSVLASAGLVWVLPETFPLASPALEQAKLVDALIPILAAGVIAGLILAWRVRMAEGVPPGDLLTLVEPVGSVLSRAPRGLTAAWQSRSGRLLAAGRKAAVASMVDARVMRLEKALSVFPIAGACLIVVVGMAVVISMTGPTPTTASG